MRTHSSAPRYHRSLLVAVLILAGNPVLAATVLAEWHIAVSGPPANRQVTSTDLNGASATAMPSDDVQIVVDCSGGASCTTVRLAVDRNDPSAFLDADPAASASRATFTLHAISLAGQGASNLLALAPDASGALVNAGAFLVSRPRSTVTAMETATLDSLLRHPCPHRANLPPYDWKTNRAEVNVTPWGALLGGADNLADFDEDDVLVVTIVAHDELLLNVQRTSPIRDSTIVRLQGETKTDFAFRSAVDHCITQKFEIADFAPGEGKVEISTWRFRELCG